MRECQMNIETPVMTPIQRFVRIDHIDLNANDVVCSGQVYREYKLSDFSACHRNSLKIGMKIEELTWYEDTGCAMLQHRSLSII